MEEMPTLYGDDQGDREASDHSAYFTVAQAAQHLKVSHSTVWRWIEAGTLPAHRVGPKAIRIMKRDLKKIIHPANEKEGKPSRETTTDSTSRLRRTLTDQEARRRLMVLQKLTASRAQLRASHGGVAMPSSVELIRQSREELDERL